MVCMTNDKKVITKENVNRVLGRGYLNSSKYANESIASLSGFKSEMKNRESLVW